jgi:polysaccharide pyruvyl transferase WcaK-like protein
MFEKMRHKENAQIIVAEGVEEFKSILDSMDLIVTSKLHPGVMGLSGHVPTVCIAYDHKQTGLFKLLDMEDCVIPVMEVSYQTISSKIDLVWRNRDRIRARLQVRIPELQEDTKKAIQEALSIRSQEKKDG